MRARILVSVLALVAVALVPGMGNAAPPAPTGEVHNVEPSIRGASGDVLLHDGGSAYAGNDSVAYIYDSFTSERRDFFNFFPWRRRSFSLQSSLINNGSAVVCDGFSRIGAFSARTPQWYEELDADGESLLGDASIVCSVDNAGKNGFAVFYPDTNPDQLVDLTTECVRFTRVDATSYTFTAPGHTTAAPCEAAIYSFTNPQGKEWREYTFIGYSSAPFEVTTVFDA